MNVKCDVCAQAPFVNEFHAATIHTKAYHDLIRKIQEKFNELKPEVCGIPEGAWSQSHFYYYHAYKELLESEK